MSMHTEPFRFGVETLLERPERATIYHRGYGAIQTSKAVDLAAKLSNKRVALLSHPAGVDRNLTPSVDRIESWMDETDSPRGSRLTALFGPQHGLRGEKQDNMIESDDYFDSVLSIPTFSLYGTSRRITPDQADTFDVVLVDMQDVGVRVYTFLTTLAYILEDLQRFPEKEVWVLDRPNPTGRIVEGLALESGHESFVGVDTIPMQHGLTLGEFALHYHEAKALTSKLTVVPMTGWNATNPQQAWPDDRVWVPPSPNMPGLYTARAYPGTVMLEGTTLSEARGTTRPLSMIGHPRVDWRAVLSWIGQWPVLHGCHVRKVTFQPTFHKHAGVPTNGIELVTEGRFWDPDTFRPYRLIAALLKGIHTLYPDLPLWTDPPYEYENDRIPIDVITGGHRFRRWIEDPHAQWEDIEISMQNDEEQWRELSQRSWLY